MTLQDDPNFAIAKLAMMRMDRAPKDSASYAAVRNIYLTAFNRLVWRGYPPNQILRALGVYEDTEVNS